MGTDNEQYTCEAVVSETTVSGKPTLVKCGKPARLRGIATVCDECWKRIRGGHGNG
jgi:hypothetical protein